MVMDSTLYLQADCFLNPSLTSLSPHHLTTATSIYYAAAPSLGVFVQRTQPCQGDASMQDNLGAEHSTAPSQVQSEAVCGMYPNKSARNPQILHTSQVTQGAQQLVTRCGPRSSVLQQQQELQTAASWVNFLVPAGMYPLPAQQKV